MRVRGATRLHSHHGSSLTDMTTRAGYTLVHHALLHALLHGMARTWGAHDVTLLHLHAGLGWKWTLHHLEHVS